MPFWEDNRDQKKIIVFDLDDTICEPPYEFNNEWSEEQIHEYYMKSRLKDGALQALSIVKEAGFIIEILTARRAQDFDITDKWLKLNEVPYDALYVGKPRAKLYVDDRGYHFKGTWDSETVLEIMKIGGSR